MRVLYRAIKQKIKGILNDTGPSGESFCGEWTIERYEFMPGWSLRAVQTCGLLSKDQAVTA